MLCKCLINMWICAFVRADYLNYLLPMVIPKFAY
ncbi:Hypothetical Protein XCAW_04494 [Xanthomonas citri subsp. citri Aw12879]|nr:Hypothetical Protein XCAW_04494 [Xanthomonas citri subsp. citri Aw12879]